MYTFQVHRRPLNVHLKVIVPVCDGYYAKFTPCLHWLDLGFHRRIKPFLFDLPQGYGAIIREDVPPGTAREQFYEPFRGKWYYQGLKFDGVMNNSGTYYVYYWDHYQTGEDYVAVLGDREIFFPHGYRTCID